jgi:hypothetical protein
LTSTIFFTPSRAACTAAAHADSLPPTTSRSASIVSWENARPTENHAITTSTTKRHSKTNGADMVKMGGRSEELTSTETLSWLTEGYFVTDFHGWVS